MAVAVETLQSYKEASAQSQSELKRRLKERHFTKAAFTGMSYKDQVIFLKDIEDGHMTHRCYDMIKGVLRVSNKCDNKKSTSASTVTAATPTVEKKPEKEKETGSGGDAGGATVGSIYTAVGHAEVIKMDYYIGIGSISSGYMEHVLAYTESFVEGVSLSEIRWGFYNTSSAGDISEANIQFTLHDIAGKTFGEFIKIKSGTQLIYFHGPTSAGTFWDGGDAVYSPNVDECNIEFSPSQGFTYTFSGTPLVHMAKTTAMVTPINMIINGFHDNVDILSTGNTFKEYMNEFMLKWNDGLPACKTTAKISEIQIEDEGASAKMKDALPVITEKYENKDGAPVATTMTRIQPLEIAAGTTLADAIRKIWQERFVSAQKGEKDATPAQFSGSVLEVNIKSITPTIALDLKLLTEKESTEVTALEKICIGSDVNCIGALYRAQLVNIKFGGLINILGIVATQHDESSSAASNTGSDTKTNECTTPSKELGPEQKQENINVKDYATFVSKAGQETFDPWGELHKILNKNKSPELTIDVEMPYSFGFTPKFHGGLLVDSVKGASSGAIHYTQGASLQFYWYDSPLCSNLIQNPVISTDYRITKVTHTIGLNGNTTQVSLSHLNLDIGTGGTA